VDSQSSIPLSTEIEHIKSQIAELDALSNASGLSSEKKERPSLKITEGFVSLCCKDQQCARFIQRQFEDPETSGKAKDNFIKELIADEEKLLKEYKKNGGDLN
jgi:hypothetical protein